MKTLKILWMYPDILNNYGGRGNLLAIKEAAVINGITPEVKIIGKLGDPVDFMDCDIAIFGAGELRTVEAMTAALKENQSLKEAIDAGKYIFAFSQTGALFGETTHRQSGEVLKGLGYLPIDFEEKEGVYGDDLVAEVDGMKLLGTQIQLLNGTLKDPSKSFGQVLYGYGNDYYSHLEGARTGNLIYTNLEGPLFVNNPWYADKVIGEALGMELTAEGDFDVEKYRDKYPLAVKYFLNANGFVDSKEKPSDEKMEFYVK